MADPTREQLEAELARLNDKLGGGVVRVQSGDRSTQYDLAAMRARRDEIRVDLARMSSRGRVRQIRTFSTKGL